MKKTPDRDFANYYKTQIYAKISANRACISLYDGEYGPPGNKITVTGKTWKEAFQNGVIEGLLIYPIAAFIEIVTTSINIPGGAKSLLILITTLIIRGNY